MGVRIPRIDNGPHRTADQRMADATIATVTAREILDCRLEPTVRVTVETTAGTAGTADVPAGRSTGRHEALERRDGGFRYDGLGVREAVAAVEDDLAAALTGVDVRDQSAVDAAITAADGTDRFEYLGANATTGTSLAAAKAGARASGRPLHAHVADVADTTGTRLPVPFLDMIEGGELAATDLDFQEHQLVPIGADSIAEAVRMGAEVYYELGDRLERDWGPASRNVGVEGGYTPPGMADPRDAFDALLGAAEERGYGDAFVLAIDAAATHFHDPETDTYAVMDESLTPGELVDRYTELADAYPLASIEDPLAEDDFETTAALTEAYDGQVVGDDLFVTQADRVERGIATGAASALLLKVNQVGTLTGALEAASTASHGEYAVQVSERSGQTPDTWLADLAVGVDAGQIKTGVSRGERTEQYNRLLEIEDALGDDGAFGDPTLG